MPQSVAKKFGTFKGVYTPSLLTILGVIMYLRMGWVVGHAGLLQSLIIVTISSLITFVTALSISATATNMKVEGGGAYYMISRSLGVEIGAAVGIPLFLAQALGISFYVVGFAESVISIFPDLSVPMVAVACLIALTALAYTSADLALKVQFFVLAAILLSLASFFWGTMNPPPLEEQVTQLISQESFWTVFAVFFPAVTGILSGVAMSGDLKDPSHSLPLGTIMAVLTGYVIYMTIPICLYYVVPESVLKSDLMVMAKISKVSQLFFIGIWGATLSSALGGLLGAPRTLQALAKDSVVFKQLSKTYGVDENPRTATLVSFIIALLGILLGDLNAIAPVLSMFYLTSYGLLNFSAGIEGLIASPSWRPKFKPHWALSMLGAFLCSATMFMINPGATFLAAASVFLVYYYMQTRNMVARWEDMRRGILMLLARYSIYKLGKTKPNAKSWRPNFLVLSGAPTNRWYLIEFAHHITSGKGFLTVASVLQKNESNIKRRLSFSESIQDYLKKRRVSALVEVSLADDVNDGLHALVQTYGMGALAPNTILLGETEKEENFRKYAEFIQFSYFNQKNVVMFREGINPIRERHRMIHVWWGRERQNAGLMLALAYMLQLSPDWKGAELYLNTIVKSEAEKTAAEKSLKNMLANGRLDVKLRIIVQEDWKESLSSTITKTSQDADLVFIGMRPPDEKESYEDYCNYYQSILVLTQDLPATAITVAAQDIDFAGIFV
ncbi:amino acid permease [Pseudobacteriovorax antillogorgiicola]|uniref:Transporter, cation-chloride cotransporter (CCC) family n=1 Tax=Pseudobacteriovorax antillogorgiicola TaxID=1513793 RepID=A0A1Y6B5U5_9BACT|nr:amino acid permease [Pseudobacteriovorax antillogorgiicola]TCS58870.1 cation-chloride cotransporter (CCC family) [Pseudobacteriovorax antillogorgiicola]SME93830.1 transporter, cation-chloride cotransporter (CCC) family [Pseudobacteriovorax antillogorgiicola]